MKLYDYLKKLNIEINDKVDLEILNVTSDSRKCDEESLYINLNEKYLINALENNPKVIVSEKYIDNYDGIIIYVKDINSFYYNALKNFYNINKGIKIGVTGTCGKTTTVTLLYKSLKYTNANLLLISSNGNFTYINKEEKYYKTINTTPDIETIYKLIDKFNYDYIIIEVSSQGIMNHRINGILFDVCCFLNLSNDHLDYHKTISNYLNAKLKLFKQLKKDGIAIVNDNTKFKNLFYFDNIKTYSFGIDSGDYSISYENLSLEKMKIKIQDKSISTTLTGEYNAENISCVNAILNVLEIDNSCLIKTLENGFKVPGRFEIIKYLNNLIIIDFAHTEYEVEVLLKHVSNYKYNNLYTIIGCGGNRDNSKRPVFGMLTTTYSEFVILTEDNSRNENVIDILEDVKKGITKDNYSCILNRYDAIKYGISLLKDNDILLIIGKGIEETYYNDKLLTDLDMVYEVINNEYK